MLRAVERRLAFGQHAPHCGAQHRRLAVRVEEDLRARPELGRGAEMLIEIAASPLFAQQQELERPPVTLVDGATKSRRHQGQQVDVAEESAVAVCL
jgi:hypothetical protein